MLNKKIWTLLVVMFVTGCGGESSNVSSLPGSGSTTITPTGSTTAATIALTATPNAINTGQTSTIQATVTTSTGANVPDGTTVTFALNSPTMGTLQTTSATTTNGVAQTILTAGSVAGSAVIVATSGSATNSVTITVSAPMPPTVTVAATPSTMYTSGTSNIQATVTSGGTPVADGTTVNFSVSDPARGTVDASAQTSGGVATATFTAASLAGSVVITASTGGGTGTATITISALPGAGISFYSATPQIIGLQGSGQTTTSAVVFRVTDTSGQPAQSASVNFSMIGPNGGEYLDVNDATPTVSQGSTNVDGLVTVVLNSGNVAGTVTITASLATNPAISASSAIISMGGGVPSHGHFNIASSRLNLPGLAVSGETATITAYVADRYGNYNLLDGTTVNFYTEAGALSTAGVTNQGVTTSELRTQLPIPKNVAPLSWEDTLAAYVDSAYSTSIFDLLTGKALVHPRDGWVTVLATVNGEEAFDDANGDGIYTDTPTPEPFTDLGEPFYDNNGDGCRNDGTNKNCNGVVSPSSEPFEIYIDANGNGQYDGPNGVWDGPGCAGAGCRESKIIWTSVTVMFTSGPAYCRIMPRGGDIADGGPPLQFGFLLGDTNLNTLVAGTRITVTADAGKLSGTKTWTLIDGVSVSPTEISFMLSDSNAGDTSPAEPYSITVEVTPPAGSPIAGCIDTVFGRVD